MTTETAVSPAYDTSRRVHFDWVLPALFQPRRTFERIAAYSGDAWLTPILIIMIVALVSVAVAGPLKQAEAQQGQALPPDFQFWSPEQQAQFMQAQSATSGPVFIYVFPALLSVLSAWLGWLLVVGVLHLVLTTLGGRGSTRRAMNIVAWASLPFAVRETVRVAAMLLTRQLIHNPGLSGFAPAGDGALSLFAASLLRLVDLYLVWHILLLILGVRAGDGLATGKAAGGVLVTIAIVLILQALPGFLFAQLSGLSIIRPFFF